MDLKRVEINWEKLATTDPFWAVLSWPDKKGGRWDSREFFESGDQEIKDTLDFVSTMSSVSYGRALDFGSGLGRLTQTLGQKFENAVGVDISESMVLQARELNTNSNVSFVHNTTSDLKIFKDNNFDFIYTRLTLQHMPWPHMKNYLNEFARILKPGGVMLFVIPDRLKLSLSSFRRVKSLNNLISLAFPDGLLNFIRYATGYIHNSPTMEMHSMKSSEVLSVLNENGLEVLDVSEFGKLPHGWKSMRYTAKKSQT